MDDKYGPVVIENVSRSEPPIGGEHRELALSNQRCEHAHGNSPDFEVDRCDSRSPERLFQAALDDLIAA